MYSTKNKPGKYSVNVGYYSFSTEHGGMQCMGPDSERNRTRYIRKEMLELLLGG